MTDHATDPAASEAGDRCDFCRLPIPADPVEATVEGDDYTFCSRACRDAMADADRVFTEHHGHRHITVDVAALDASLPQGLPRNAFVLCSGEAGTRDRALHAELVWRTLQRGEPAVVVSFQEPPGSVVQEFLSLEWNVLPYLESGQLHIVDCFTYRLSHRERMFDRMDDWNSHLYDVAAEATTTIRDPSDLGEVENKLDNALEARGMVDQGVVLIDSLTELGTLVQPVQAYNFVKDIRADVCKGRFVPIFAGATLSADPQEFPHDLTYVADGLVEMRLTEDIVPGTLIKQVRIRKLNGVLVVPEWHAYEYTSGHGMVVFDPEEELDAAAADESESPDTSEGTVEGTEEARDEAEEPTGELGAAASVTSGGHTPTNPESGASDDPG